MNTNETANQILEESASTNPQLTENPEKVQEAGLWAQIKAKKKYIFTGIGIVVLAGAAYGIGSKKLVVGVPGLRKDAVTQLPKKIVEAAPVAQIEFIKERPETMTRKEYCHRLADFHEALYDFDNELNEIRFKIMWEDNPERKAWFVAAQERLLRAKDETEENLKQFTAEHGSVFWTTAPS